eukprot:CAMPEP_0182493194 /NCGR_PEP_ID=MMETSP1321-20130603/2188_1 /TAXON_ID=91990 /ORGANISM="Bolidomonas sp., Strain RCC1657" /LENGTH=561 /DNA_ID=CAMNT_0024695889 /DNA_START=718 /DNA_END=2399 /DNA_ORIENTATION=+
MNQMSFIDLRSDSDEEEWVESPTTVATTTTSTSSGSSTRLSSHPKPRARSPPDCEKKPKRPKIKYEDDDDDGDTDEDSKLPAQSFLLSARDLEFKKQMTQAKQSSRYEDVERLANQASPPPVYGTLQSSTSPTPPPASPIFAHAVTISKIDNVPVCGLCVADDGAGADTTNNDEDDENDRVFSAYNADVSNIQMLSLDGSTSSLTPVLCEVANALRVLGGRVPDARIIYDLAQVLARKKKCPNVKALAAAVVILIACGIPPTVAELQQIMAKFTSMCWTNGDERVYEELLRDSTVSVLEAKRLTDKLYDELGGDLAYFLKWYMSPPKTGVGERTTSPFVAAVIVISSLQTDGKLPSPERWAEIGVAEKEGLKVARSCSVSLTIMSRFFPNTDDARTLSAQIRSVWNDIAGKARFKIRNATLTELKDGRLKDVAVDLGCVEGKEHNTEEFDIDDDDLLTATMKYKDIKRCVKADCDKLARYGGGQPGCCIGHGGGLRCKQPGGCTKSAQHPTEFCIGHGGGPRCKQPGGCNSSAVGGTDFCVTHGGGKRCTFSGGCDSSAQG